MYKTIPPLETCSIRCLSAAAMTDVSLNFNSHGGFHRNDIVNLGNVIQNCGFDEAELRSRVIHQNKGLSPLYNGSMNEMTMSVQVGDVVWCRTDEQRNTRRGQLRMCFSSLNGCMDKGDQPWQFFTKYTLVGIANTPARRDDRNKNPEFDFTTRLGGLDTVVAGPDAISAGDLIVADIPDPKNPVPSVLGKRPDGGRITAFLRPFKPGMDSLTHQSLKDILIRKSGRLKMSNIDTDANYPVMEGACMIGNGLLTAGLVLIRVLHQYGLVTVNAAALGIRDGAGRATHASRNQPLTNEQWADLAHAIGVVNTCEPGAETERVKVPKKAGIGKAPVEEDLAKVIMEAFVGSGEWVVPLENQLTVPAGRTGVVHNAQRSMLTEVVKGVTKAQEAQRSRIVGRAISGCAPGGEFDILMGSYGL